MTLRLSDLKDSFEGVIPAIIATVDADGVPNISYLSHVYYIDDRRVALSNQFFSKTAANIAATGRATLMVVNGRDAVQHLLDLVPEAVHETGELFERMAAHLKAMSAGQGMADIMKLRSADVFRVESCTRVPSPASKADIVVEPKPTRDHLGAAARLAAVIAGEADIDAMLERVLDELGAAFGFGHVMVLIPGEDGAVLTTLASRGYATEGVGSEVRLGEGAIGIAAESRLPLRLADMSRGRRYAAAVKADLAIEARAIPLPGLAEPNSQLAVPLMHGGRLYGVLFAEAADRFAFSLDDEAALGIVAAQLAAAFRLHETDDRDAASAPAPSRAAKPEGVLNVRHYPFDDSVFVDGRYLIKGVPGRLLIHMLRQAADKGTRDFTNRALRLEPGLRLPDVKDNLEARLILLRRRLEEHGAGLRLTRPGRGQLRLELAAAPRIETMES